MANHIKPKIALSVFSISIIALIPLLESNFNTPVTIKRWGRLEWEDFQGLVPFFPSYDAHISCSVYLDYNAKDSSFYAYAGQNNVRSWVKLDDNVDRSYLLNHEQYHFNITELHARRMN